MKTFRRPWSWSLPGLALLLACEKKAALPLSDFYGFADIATLELKAPRTTYHILEDSLLAVQVTAFDGERRRVAVPDSVFEFFVNDAPTPRNRIAFREEGTHTLRVRLGEKQSDALTITSVFRVKALRLTADRPQYALDLENAPIRLTAEALDAGGKPLTDFGTDRIQFFANGNLLPGNQYTPTQAGRHRLSARFNTVESAPAELTVLTPTEAIGEVNLELQERSGVPFITADGQSKVRFDVRLTGRDGRVLTPRTAPVVRANGQALGADYTFQTTTPSTYRLVASVYGRESTPLEIKARPVETYPVVRLPVVIHVINLPDFKPAEGSYQDVIDRVNANYRRRAAPLAAADDPTWSDTFVEFELARFDPAGNAMPNPGVDVVTGPRAGYSQEEIRNFVFNTCYWNPNEYLNVFVFTCTDCQGMGGYAYYPTLVDNVNFRETDRTTRPPYYAYGTFMMANLHSSVLTHEWGHNLDLPHVFNGDGINGVYPNACASDPDFCEDTPYYNRGEQPANLPNYGRVSCFGQRYFSTNFMDYAAYNQAFSYDQRRRMRRAIDLALWVPTPANRRRSGRAGLPGILQPNRAPEHDPRRWVACPLPPPVGPDSPGALLRTFAAGRLRWPEQRLSSLAKKGPPAPRLHFTTGLAAPVVLTAGNVGLAAGPSKFSSRTPVAFSTSSAWVK